MATEDELYKTGLPELYRMARSIKCNTYYYLTENIPSCKSKNISLWAIEIQWEI